MGDIQSQDDARGISIPVVGIVPVALPLRYRDEETGAIVPVDAEACLATDLSALQRGTHMSRLAGVLMEGAREAMTASSLLGWLDEARRGLPDARRCQLAVRFRYHLSKPAPESRLSGYVPFLVELRAWLSERERRIGWRVAVPVTTLCPCSQAVSRRGAHNQRGLVTITAAFRSAKRFPSLGAFLTDAEQLGSCPLYSVLEQPDERWVTESAWDRPKFVEDVLRDTVAWLTGRDDLSWFAARVAADESIHPHNALAYYDQSWDDEAHARPRFWAWEPWA